MVPFKSSDFVVAEQMLGAYFFHIFLAYEQFVMWRKDNPEPKIVDKRCARGRKLPGIDHRFEFEYYPYEE